MRKYIIAPVLIVSTLAVLATAAAIVYTLRGSLDLDSLHTFADLRGVSAALCISARLIIEAARLVIDATAQA